MVERAAAESGPWQVVGRGISDAAWPYRPLFCDTSVEVGRPYFYRVKAKDRQRISEASNVVGPVTATALTLVDEMKDLTLVRAHEGVALEGGKTRQAKEDMDRVKGGSGAFIVYRTPKPMQRCKVFAFFPKAVTSLGFSTSSDGRDYTVVSAERHDYFSGEGEYGYFKPVLFEVQLDSTAGRFLKIEFGGEVEISRVEIAYGGIE